MKASKCRLQCNMDIWIYIYIIFCFLVPFNKTVVRQGYNFTTKATWTLNYTGKSIALAEPPHLHDVKHKSKGELQMVMGFGIHFFPKQLTVQTQ